MEIRKLRYILAIAKHQNLTKAAEELFISQSALTKFLHKYEEENNLTLFIKVGNRFILSENGKVFVKRRMKYCGCMTCLSGNSEL